MLKENYTVPLSLPLSYANIQFLFSHYDTTGFTKNRQITSKFVIRYAL